MYPFATISLSSTEKGEGKMSIKKKAVAFLTSFVLVLATTGTASAYYGGWLYDNNRGGSEILILGDGEGYGLYLRGTSSWCGSPGASYAAVRRVLNRNSGEQIDWWIDADCGSKVRVCVENWRGDWACSTYRSQGWHVYE